MAKKKVYAAMELADREVRLVVSEVFDGRNNILRVEKVPCSGLVNAHIEDEAAVVKAIQQAVKQAQAALGYRIERVLLAIPGQDVQRSTQKVRVSIEDGTRNIRLFHVQQGLNRAIQKRVSDENELINVNQILYTVEGETSPKLPVGKETDSFDMEVDLLYASKELLYSYVKAIELANLEVLDICLDIYALAQETAALSKSEDQPVILLDLEADHTTLALLMYGKIQHTVWMEQGFSSFIKDMQQKYALSDETAARLLQNIFSADLEENTDSIIYIEQQEDRRVEITARELAESVLPHIRRWIAEINAASSPIVSGGSARYILAGQGSNIPVLREMEKAFNAPASVYRVTSIGARDGAYGVPLGLSYAFEARNAIQKEDKTSVNNNELEESIESIARYGKEDEGGFTQKLKKVMLTGRD